MSAREARAAYLAHRDECNTCNLIELCDIGQSLLNAAADAEDAEHESEVGR